MQKMIQEVAWITLGWSIDWQQTEQLPMALTRFEEALQLTEQLGEYILSLHDKLRQITLQNLEHLKTEEATRA